MNLFTTIVCLALVAGLLVGESRDSAALKAATKVPASLAFIATGVLCGGLRHGVFDKLADPAIADRLIEAVYDAIEDMPARARRSDDAIREAVRIGLRRCLRTLCGKRPNTEIHLVRV